jgi:predicted nucleic acid-binding protein
MNCFIDSNVWLYTFIEGQDEGKAGKAKLLI